MTKQPSLTPTGRTPQRRRYLASLFTVGVAVTLAADGASAASTPTLTATAVQITDHPAYVQALVESSGTGLAKNSVQATDQGPADGTANLPVSYPFVASRVPLRTAHGISVRVVEVGYGLSVGMGALPGAFKYLSYSVAGGDRLAVDLWKTTSSRPGTSPAGRAAASRSARSRSRRAQ
jgi:hypothetical protein